MITYEDTVSKLMEEFPEEKESYIRMMVTHNEIVTMTVENGDYEKVYKATKYFFKTKELKDRGMK